MQTKWKIYCQHISLNVAKEFLIKRTLNKKNATKPFSSILKKEKTGEKNFNQISTHKYCKEPFNF